MPDRVTTLGCSNALIEATVLHGVRNEEVPGGIVVNLSSAAVVCQGDVDSILPPWRSTILRPGRRIAAAACLGVFRVRGTTNLGGLPLLGWDWYGDRNRKFGRNLPLYISPQDSLGTVEADPLFITNEHRTPGATQPFELKLNLWWAPPETDCSIHIEHPFLELHTQVHGVGHMEKFRERDEATLYEDVAMAPGMTHEPFARVAGPSSWVYPWHRYYAQTECVWLAIELHPLG